MKKFEKMMIFAAAAAMLTGCAAVSAVSADEAEELVRQQEGFQDAIVVEVDEDRSEGICELDVVVGDVVYEFEVDTRTGQIRQTDREQARGNVDVTGLCTLEEAKALSFEHAGVPMEAAADISCDFDDGYYDIEFTYEGLEYEYRIRNTGEILRSEREPEVQVSAASRPAETVPVETAPRTITREEALDAAFTHCGVSAAQASRTECEWDDGCWEIEFRCDGCEYEYKISGSGAILEADRDVCDNDCDWDDDDDDCDRERHRHGGHHG